MTRVFNPPTVRQRTGRTDVIRLNQLSELRGTKLYDPGEPPELPQEKLDAIYDAIEKLSEAERDVVIMRAQGLTWEIIADYLKVNRGTPTKVFKRAVTKIRKELDVDITEAKGPDQDDPTP